MHAFWEVELARRLVANKVFDFSHDLHTRWIPFRVEGACSIHRGTKSRIGLHFRANRPVRSTERSTIRGIRIARLAHFIRNQFDVIAARPGISTRYTEAENKPGDRQVYAHQTPVPLPLDLGGRWLGRYFPAISALKMVDCGDRSYGGLHVVRRLIVMVDDHKADTAKEQNAVSCTYPASPLVVFLKICGRCNFLEE